HPRTLCCHTVTHSAHEVVDRARQYLFSELERGAVAQRVKRLAGLYYSTQRSTSTIAIVRRLTRARSLKGLHQSFGRPVIRGTMPRGAWPVSPGKSISGSQSETGGPGARSYGQAADKPWAKSSSHYMTAVCDWPNEASVWGTSQGDQCSKKIRILFD